MDKNTYIIILYDFYKKLFNDKEQQYFEDYYFNNLTLEEVSENMNVSRNNVHKTLKGMEQKLLDYEDKLELYRKNNELENIISTITDEKLVNKIKKTMM